MKSWKEAYKILQNSSKWNKLEKYLKNINEDDTLISI